MRYFSTLRCLFIILLGLFFSACNASLPSIKPYKIDVQQGNVVTSKMLLQLRPGMTKSQVRFIMGTPLIQDSFHGNRWDYVYQMREAGKITEQRRVILDFDNELLKAVRGDVIPKGTDAPDEERANVGTRLIEPNKKQEEKGLIDKLKFWGKDDAPAAQSNTEKLPLSEVKSEPVLTAQPEIASDADASQSMMAVPLVVPVAESVVAAPVMPVTPAVEAPVANPVKLHEVAESVSIATPADTPQASVPMPVAAPVVTELPLAPLVYESTSGMVFDRKLRSFPDEVDADAVEAMSAARIGNKVVPTPKDLPLESEPSFFDRMLEKIGF